MLINFWASWCEPCKVEHEFLQQIAREFKDRLSVLGMVYQDSAEKARHYLEPRTNQFPQLLDPDSRVAVDYGVSGVPESFFVDQNGQVLHKEAGVVTADLWQKMRSRFGF